MRVRIAALADFASIAEGQKLNLLGIFSNLSASGEPIVHPVMYVVAQFEFRAGEQGNKASRLALLDEDGREVVMLTGQLSVPAIPPGETTIVNQIVALNNLTLPKFGRYEFRLVLDGATVVEIPLTVARALPPGPLHA